MTDEGNFDNEITDNQNTRNVQCQFCNSLILKPKSAQYIEICEFELPLMHQKNSTKIDDIATEPIDKFWAVDDIYTFENIGFSNTVHSTKFLICADCEMGPVGYHDVKTKKSFIALKRVKHV